MATMLVFLLTDANIQSHQLKECLKKAVDVSFHCLSVDGDTSTNDSVFLLANGMSEMANIPSFQQALNEACVDLAKMIAKDGEGATKLILIKVRGSKSKEEAREVGRRIAVSPLVKTAFFGADPNVGRILCAIGNFPFEAPPSVDIFLSGEKVAENGMIIKFNKKKMRDFLKNKREIEVEINLKRGNSSAIVYTCDLSYDYVKINAEYTT
jgi:glutamate N-acetyltransferase/amino-acid N-acetyltransferase